MTPRPRHHLRRGETLALIAQLLAALTLAAAALHLTLAALTGAQTCRMEQLPQCPRSMEGNPS